MICCYCSVAKLWPHGLQHTRLPVLHHLPEFAQIHAYWFGDAIQPFHPLSSPSPPAFYHSTVQINQSRIKTFFHYYPPSLPCLYDFWGRTELWLLLSQLRLTHGVSQPCYSLDDLSGHRCSQMPFMMTGKKTLRTTVIQKAMLLKHETRDSRP